MPTVICAYCGNPTQKPTGSINRAAKAGLSLYCDRTCSGMGRRNGKTLEQKKEEKRLYDLEYRATNPTLKQRKAAYHKKTYDRAKAAEQRKANMPRHVEYCRRPEYKEWKKGYDEQYRAQKQYGEFGAVSILLKELEREVLERGGDRFQRAATNGTLNKKQTRRRDFERVNSNKP